MRRVRIVVRAALDVLILIPLDLCVVAGLGIGLDEHAVHGLRQHLFALQVLQQLRGGEWVGGYEHDARIENEHTRTHLQGLGDVAAVAVVFEHRFVHGGPRQLSLPLHRL